MSSFSSQILAQAKLWDKTYGGIITTSSEPNLYTDEYEQYGYASLQTMVRTQDGGYLLGGSSDSEIGNDKSQDSRDLNDYSDTEPDEGPYYTDYWVVKIDNSGNKVWDKRFGGSLFDQLTAIVATSDGGFLLGGWSRSGISGDKSQAQRTGGYCIDGRCPMDYWVVKIDGSGNKLWDKAFGGGGFDYLETLVATSDGGFLLGGTSDSGVNGDKTQANHNDFECSDGDCYTDYWLVKIDGTGNKLWDKTYGGYEHENMQTILSMPDGGFLLGGSSSSGISGNKSTVNKGYTDYWVVKIDASGNKIWDKTFGGNSWDRFSGLITTPDNNYLLAGSSNSGISGDKSQSSRGLDDYWIVKINSSGTKLWDRTFGGSNYDNFSKITATPDGDYLLGGSSKSGISSDKSEASRGEYDYWIVRINASGNKVWDKTYGGNGWDTFSDLVATTDGHFLLGGSSPSVISGEKTAPKKAFNDYWVVKIKGAPYSYCIPVVTYSCSNGDFINNFRFNTLINNNTGCNGQANGFMSYVPSGTFTSTVTKGVSYSISMQSGASRAQGFGVWIDYNNDKDFNDAGEFVYSSPTFGTSIYSGTITIPATATAGSRKLRVRSRYNSTITATQSCTAFTYGETEDYTITIQERTSIWNVRFGGSGTETFSSVIKTSDGGYLLGGSSASAVSGDRTQPSQGSIDFWIVKTNSAGTKLWDKRFGGTGDDRLYDIIATADGGYLLGGSSDSGNSGDKTQASQGGVDYWLVKINSTGTKQWDKRFGGSGFETVKKILQLPTGEYIVAGVSNSGISGDKTQTTRGGQDYWVVKISSTGTKIWDKRFGGASTESLEGLVLNPDGSFMLGGYSLSGISGERTQASQGDYDYWLVKISSAGAKVWDKRYGGVNADRANSLIATTDGGYLLGGTSASGIGGDKSQDSRGGLDYWVVKVNNTGAKLWDKRFGGTTDDNLTSTIITSEDSGFLLGGFSISGISGDKTQSSRGSSDYWIVKLNSSGTKLWDKRFGGTAADELRTIIPITNSYLLAGHSASGLNGDKYQNTRGGLDYWIVKIGLTGGEIPVMMATESPTRTSMASVNQNEIKGFKEPALSLMASPNPMRDQLRVNFSVTETQPINIRIFDLQGRTLKTLFDDEAQANKEYELIWHPEINLAEGLYIIHLQAKNKVKQQKILYQK